MFVQILFAVTSTAGVANFCRKRLNQAKINASASSSCFSVEFSETETFFEVSQEQLLVAAVEGHWL